MPTSLSLFMPTDRKCHRRGPDAMEISPASNQQFAIGTDLKFIVNKGRLPRLQLPNSRTLLIAFPDLPTSNAPMIVPDRRRFFATQIHSSISSSEQRFFAYHYTGRRIRTDWILASLRNHTQTHPHMRRSKGEDHSARMNHT